MRQRSPAVGEAGAAASEPGAPARAAAARTAVIVEMDSSRRMARVPPVAARGPRRDREAAESRAADVTSVAFREDCAVWETTRGWQIDAA